MSNSVIEIYTDGSCHTQLKVGAWASILLIGEREVVLHGVAKDTTHQRMELMAVIESFSYLQKMNINDHVVKVITDSAYVTNLDARFEKLLSCDFKNAKGNDIPNVDLLKHHFTIQRCFDVTFIKIKAHQRMNTRNINREVDLLVRRLVREQSRA